MFSCMTPTVAWLQASAARKPTSGPWRTDLGAPAADLVVAAFFVALACWALKASRIRSRVAFAVSRTPSFAAWLDDAQLLHPSHAIGLSVPLANLLSMDRHEMSPLRSSVLDRDQSRFVPGSPGDEGHVILRQALSAIHHMPQAQWTVESLAAHVAIHVRRLPRASRISSASRRSPISPAVASRRRRACC